MEKTTYVLVSLVATIVMRSLAPLPVEAAPDLTGTWEGTADCRGFNGANVRIVFEDDLSFTQVGTSVKMRFGEATFYRGLVIADVAHPNTQGSAAIAACGTTDDLQGQSSGNNPPGLSELIDMDVVTPAQNDSRLRATTVFFLENGKAFGFGEGPVIGTCRLTYVRVDTRNPRIRNCP